MNTSERREKILRAAWAVALRDGVDGASMRTIAREAGVTTGSVTHHFRNKAELLEAALTQLSESTAGNFLQAAVACKTIDEIIDLLIAVLPIAENDRADWQVWLAFFGYAASRPDILQAQRARYALLQSAMVQALSRLQQESAIEWPDDVGVLAAAVLAVLDGYALQILMSDQAPPTAEIRRVLHRLLAH